jgi:hypothetical protein
MVWYLDCAEMLYAGTITMTRQRNQLTMAFEKHHQVCESTIVILTDACCGLVSEQGICSDLLPSDVCECCIAEPEGRSQAENNKNTPSDGAKMSSMIKRVHYETGSGLRQLLGHEGSFGVQSSWSTMSHAIRPTSR